MCVCARTCQGGVTSSGSVLRRIPRQLFQLTFVTLRLNQQMWRTATSGHAPHSESNLILAGMAFNLLFILCDWVKARERTHFLPPEEFPSAAIIYFCRMISKRKSTKHPPPLPHSVRYHVALANGTGRWCV